MVMFPQKINNRWLLLSWNREALHTEVYRSFLRAIINYQKELRSER